MSKNKTLLGIFTESIGLYFSNFNKFVKYMSFPVLGQIIGLCFVFVLTYFYAKQMPSLIQKFPILDNFTLLVVISILITLPGLAIFCKAFWEYLVAYGAINSMLENMLRSGKVYDFDAHTELIKRRTFPFIGLWFLFGLFSLLMCIPFLFWVPCAVFAVYFVLVFQVFTFEPELSPLGCVKRSLVLVKGYFFQTFTLMALVGALTYMFIPKLINTFFDYTSITLVLTNTIIPFVKDLPISEWNNFLAYLYLPPLKVDQIALFVVTTFVTQILIQYTLPLRSILWSMWYKELNGGRFGLVESKERGKKKTSKRPSEKLMQASNKKFSTKKLDRNLLKRAMEKEDKD